VVLALSQSQTDFIIFLSLKTKQLLFETFFLKRVVFFVFYLNTFQTYFSYWDILFKMGHSCIIYTKIYIKNISIQLYRVSGDWRRNFCERVEHVKLRVIAIQNFIFKERNLSYARSPSAIVNNSSRP